MRLVIFGAAGKVGRAATDEALRRGHDVVAADRAGPPEGPARGARPDWHRVDLLGDDPMPPMAGADAVLSCIGLPMGPETVLAPPPLYTEGTRRIVEAMRAAGMRRLVVISASFVTTLQRGPVWFRGAAAVTLGAVLRQMAEMERMLRESDGLDWTAVRPGWLLDAPAAGDFEVSEGAIPAGTLRTRIPDLAAFMLDCAEQGLFVGRTPAIARAEPVASSPFEMLR
ncbi:NAD(P)H-binding protein [Psychromarinibacter sp. C21-152]|uniref:NAD(P)H-binding protein n=1 Tax=Psychromarinibacter sediminicola TaxID=3033385 RepID=A0AAE3NQ59_9RHOB|nr:NAD(P)H-binding protein [Psychromarinibacter sediminicola]MDF0600409.1 NAD(P)H-binding protein [Psychromarinibacter sediminicola]